MFDVVVVGGGPAGLSAALMLGRCRRRVLVCDAGQPRNASSHALHGYLTRDGVAPAHLNALGRSELATYGVQVREGVQVTAVDREGDLFEVRLKDGRVEHARYLLIATGVVDELPDVRGLAECYGRSVFHCPYCDGWERRDRRLAALGNGRSGVQLALSLKTWSSHVVLLAHGSRLGSAALARLERNGIEVVPHRLVSLVHDEGQLSAVECEGGLRVPLDAIFFTSGQHQRCDLAEGLGCAFNRKGTVETGNRSETNIANVFVAGDASHDAQFVVVAAAEGVKAALAINQAMQQQELQP